LNERKWEQQDRIAFPTRVLGHGYTCCSEAIYLDVHAQGVMPMVVPTAIEIASELMLMFVSIFNNETAEISMIKELLELA
jgi:hypothetical protein